MNYFLYVSVILLNLNLRLCECYLNDTETYPPCLQNEDCEKNHRLTDHACFQYFCYPWKTTPTEAGEADDSGLTLCRRSKDCAEGRDCVRNYDRRGVSKGVCLEESDTLDCIAHEECEGETPKCCNGYCCSQEYFDAILTLPCTSDLGCQVSSA